MKKPDIGFSEEYSRRMNSNAVEIFLKKRPSFLVGHKHTAHENSASRFDIKEDS
jgi:hypothetical protein